MKDLSIILPVLNEADFIKKITNEILEVMEQSKIDYELILAENGSVDNSLEVLKQISATHEKVKVCVAPHKGWGIAILTGYKIVEGKYVIHMQSDGQIPPKAIPILWERRKDNTIVKMYRITRESVLRIINSKVYNLIANLLFSVRSFDINGCPKLYPKNLVEKLALVSTDSFLDLELLVKARCLGYKIRDIPLPSFKRAAGKSNTNLKTVLEFIRNMFSFKFGINFKSWQKSKSLGNQRL